MLASVKNILIDAREGGYAVGAFNTINLETTRGILDAAKETRSPVIIQVTEKTMDYAGGRAIFNLIKNCAEFYAKEIPVGIHLDHGKSFDIVQRAISIGFTSVMYDGSRKSYEDNVLCTREVVDFCREKGVVVQAELGSVPYIGEGESDDSMWDKFMTDPEEAEKFVAETGIDTLAVAIGNAHGFFKERTTPDFERLEAVNSKISLPLILHGASDWENGRVKEVISRGIACFNVDTSIRMAFINSLIKKSCNANEVSYDARKILGDAREAVAHAVKQKMEYFGSCGKA
jgi:fructose-bisphosphate aldolase class II